MGIIRKVARAFKPEPPRVLGNDQLFDVAANASRSGTRLNVGCGTDYREGFINIDGSTTLPKVDKVIDISTDSLVNHFPEKSVDYILANDIVEHHFHWEAVKLMTDFFMLLKPGGLCEIRVPDCLHIMEAEGYTPELKLVLLFGGQDVPRGIDAEMDESRKKFPQYFCHKYGWSMERMANDLRKIGFSDFGMKGEASNFITIARR